MAENQRPDLQTDSYPAEVFVSVDVETAGPNPARYAILSIGACLVDDPDGGFYVELQPDSAEFEPEALAVSGLSLEQLAVEGVGPAVAMRQFEDWLAQQLPPGGRPIFTAFNAPFDWMFVDTYFQRYLGRNPFGHSALDIKAYAMGMAGSSWAATSMRELSPRYLEGRPLSHHALGDARDQAELFRALQAERASRSAESS
jgi:DNA polymerase III epsilon subunit-like protein